jgi:hypothetical protein
MSKRGLVWLPVALLTLTGGCQREDVVAAPTPRAASDGTHTLTVVDLRGAGSVKTSKVTPAALRQEVTARLNGGVRTAQTEQANCTAATLWLFDTWNYSGNSICFIGAGTVDLASYVHFYDEEYGITDYWWVYFWGASYNRVGSFVAGDSDGRFFNPGSNADMTCIGSGCGIDASAPQESFVLGSAHPWVSGTISHTRYIELYGGIY